MPGQGYHLGLSQLVARRRNKEFSEEMRIGVLIVDALNVAAGGRRGSHFCGGAGCILPQYNNLRQVSILQSWDSEYKKSYFVDPEIEMGLFEATSLHIPENDYKDGIRVHLLTDRVYDYFIQHVLFDVTQQKEGKVIARKTGEEMDGVTFRKEIYSVYPLLDQYLMNMAGITAEEIKETKQLLSSVFTDEMASFITKYLNFNLDLEWQDTDHFKKKEIDELIEKSLATICNYLK